MSQECIEEAAESAEKIIQGHVIAAMAAAVVPLPVLVDIAAVTALEVHMITKLARAYEFPVPHKLVASKVLISLAGGIGPAYISVKFEHLVKAVPVAGYAAYVAVLSISNGASVYAVGKIFQKHFESGGTFLSSGNSILRRYYKAYFAEGKKRIPAMRLEVQKQLDRHRLAHKFADLAKP